MQYNTMQYNTIQYNTIQYSAVGDSDEHARTYSITMITYVPHSSSSSAVTAALALFMLKLKKEELLKFEQL